MPEVVISKIQIDELHDEQIIILKEKKGQRSLPVVIGINEIQSIKIKLSNISMPRPLTHDLLVRTIAALNATVQSIVIDKLEENTFFAKILLEKASGEKVAIDARPSDSIAIAVRTNAPILVEEEVLSEAGVYLE